MTAYCKGCGLALRGMAPQARTHGNACWQWWDRVLKRVDAEPFDGLEFGPFLDTPSIIEKEKQRIRDGFKVSVETLPDWKLSVEFDTDLIECAITRKAAEKHFAQLKEWEKKRVRLADRGVPDAEIVAFIDEVSSGKPLPKRLRSPKVSPADREAATLAHFCLVGVRRRAGQLPGSEEEIAWRRHYIACLNKVINASWALRSRNRAASLDTPFKREREYMAQVRTLRLMVTDGSDQRRSNGQRRRVGANLKAAA